jgi:hypothetical protein
LPCSGDEAWHCHALHERAALDAFLDDLGDAPVESVEEQLEAVEDAELHDRVGRDRPQSADRIRSLGGGELALTEPSTDVA